MNDAHPNAVLLFTRYPAPGEAKTRLIPALGAEGAARLQRDMTELIVTRLRSAFIQGGFQPTVCYAGASVTAMRRWLGRGLAYEAQAGDDLGRRMARAVEARFDRGARKVLVIGADCPGVTSAVLERAFAALDRHPVVFGPAQDGGYYLVGLSRPCSELFQGIEWGNETVLRDSLARARRLGLDPALLSTLPDVDRPEDLVHWEIARREASRLAVIIPTLNEAAQLGETLDRVARGRPDEIIVADGGSTDGTVEIARQMGARVLAAPRGRARQMNAAAAVASAELLLFLHADTWPPEGYAGVIREHLNHPTVAAGAFRFALREPVRARRLLEALVWVRCRCFGTPFGDQGLFVRRDLFQAVGGFADWPLLEDVEILRRLRPHGRIALTHATGQTSGRRWMELGVLRTFVINQLVRLGFHVGVSRQHLAQFYISAGKIPFNRQRMRSNAAENRRP